MSTSSTKAASIAALLAMIANPSTTGITLTEFTLFPKLPLELRSKIWKLAVVPRLVTLNPPQGTLLVDAVPAVYHTSREARAESKYSFPLDRYFEGPVINFDADILFIREWEGHVCPKFLSVVMEAPSLLCEVKKLALIMSATNPSYLDKWIVQSGEFDEETVKNPFLLLEQVCPNLKELIFLFRPGPLGATIDDLYEYVTLDDLYSVQDVVGENPQGDLDKILTSFQKVKANGKWKSLKLTFARNETWER